TGLRSIAKQIPDRTEKRRLECQRQLAAGLSSIIDLRSTIDRLRNARPSKQEFALLFKRHRGGHCRLSVSRMILLICCGDLSSRNDALGIFRGWHSTPTLAMRKHRR